MTRMVILVVVGFLLGIGSAAGYAVLREEPQPLPEQFAAAVASEQAADSTAVPDSLAAPRIDTTYAAAPEPPEAAELATALAMPAQAETAEADSAAAAPAPPGPDAVPLERERVARMFGAMKPQEAARVLEQMDDAEVRVLLGQLSERKAGAILSSLSPQRAASISRPSLQTRRSTP
jgi:hypothetical protein